MVIRTSGNQGTTRRRATRQRSAVEALLDGHNGFRSAQELHGELRRAGDGIGLTTVYRTLERMAEAGEVDTLRSDSGEVLYRRCRNEGQHHHHLICRKCRLGVEIEVTDLENWAQRVAEAHGFSDPSHDIEIFGICRDCARATG